MTHKKVALLIGNCHYGGYPIPVMACNTMVRII